MSILSTIIDVKYADVTGDGILDIIYLTGDKRSDSSFFENISVVVHYGLTLQSVQIPFKENTGYQPTIFLGDFTGNKTNDILIMMNTGGSGGTIIAYLFSFTAGQFYKIFDFEVFNQKGIYDVQFENNYKATVLSEEPEKKYVVDLTYKDENYLAEIYTSNGTLKAAIKGWVSPLSGLYPIDYDRNGVYELLAVQHIAGRYNADGLGYVQTNLKWNGSEFGRKHQHVNINGKDLTN